MVEFPGERVSPRSPTIWKMKKIKRSTIILDLLVLIGLFWVARYWHSPHFGLYEDDLTIIPSAFQHSFTSLMQYIGQYILNLSGHARPLSDSFIYFFSWIGWQAFGLWGAYLIGFLITAVNIALFYWLIFRVASRPLALLAGFAYILFSADTTQAFLTHSLGIQPSITLIWLAFHSYLSGRKFLAYLLAFIVLFSYELPFVLFLAAPLFLRPWNKAMIKPLIKHALIITGMILAVYLFRMAIGEGRATGMTLQQLLITPIQHMLQGPPVSLGTYLYRPFLAFRALDLELTLVVIPVLLFTYIYLRQALKETPGIELHLLVRSLKDRGAREQLPQEMKSLGKMFITGAVLLVLAYPLTYTVQSMTILNGRNTRVHAAAVAGAAILIGTIMLFAILMTASSRFWRILIRTGIAAIIAFLTGYGFMIQRDYVNAWQYQRAFWTELLPLIQDAGDHNVILVDPQALKDTRQIGANYWNLPRVLYQLYDFPSDPSISPTVHRLESGWEDRIINYNGEFDVDASTVYSVPSFYGEYSTLDTILIQSENGNLVRPESIVIDGVTYRLKPITTPVLATLPRGFLYPLLIDPEN
jgi:hypothetical protein